MIWQDIVITIATIIFSIALIPQVHYGFKHKIGTIKLATSGPTFAGLYVMSFTFWTLDLYLSTIINFTTATLWLLLFLQKLIYKDNTGKK